MAEIISITDRRKDQPDPDCIQRDFRSDHVDTMYRFTGSYEFEGEEWAIEIWAADIEQARRKLTAMAGGTIDGQVFSVIES